MEKQFTESQVNEILSKAATRNAMSRKLKENKDTLRRLHYAGEVSELCTYFKERHGYDYVRDTEGKFPVREASFKWGEFKRKVMREADSGSVFTQFLRAGIQNVTVGMYEATPDTYSEWVKVIASNKNTELYAPNQGIAFPSQVGPDEIFPETGVAALDIQLQNKKFGTMYAVEKELLNDDQTGEFQRQVQWLGEYMKLVDEVLCYGKLASVSGGCIYSNLTVPKSETQPTNEATYPWSTSLQGGGANRPASYAILTQASLQAGFIGLMNQVNLQNLKMLVNPNRIIVGPQYRFDAAVLLNSAYYPSVVSATAGAVGGTFAVNELKGIADLTVSRFVFDNGGTQAGLSTSKAWYLVDDSKPWFVLQKREAVSVVQENPESGKSFERDVYRFKASSRMNADFIDPRFAWQGDDGSVTS